MADMSLAIYRVFSFAENLFFRKKSLSLALWEEVVREYPALVYC